MYCEPRNSRSSSSVMRMRWRRDGMSARQATGAASAHAGALTRVLAEPEVCRAPRVDRPCPHRVPAAREPDPLAERPGHLADPAPAEARAHPPDAAAGARAGEMAATVHEAAAPPRLAEHR